MTTTSEAAPRPAGHAPARLRPGPALRALALAGLALAAAAARAECKLTTMELPVQLVNARPVATLTLNGTPVSLLVDSGAFFSFLAPATAEALNLPLRNLPFGFTISGHTGRVEAQMTRVETVGLRGAEIKRVQFVVGGNELGSGIQGILGRNFLAVTDTEYDLAQGAVRLVVPKGDCDKTDMAYWAGEAPVIMTRIEPSLRNKDTAARVEVAINGTPLVALLDTGAPRSSLTRSAAEKVGIKPEQLTPFGRVGGAGEGLASSWMTDIDSFQLAGEKITLVRLRVDDVRSENHGMVLGMDFFLSHRVYVSHLQNKVYATWNGSPVFAAQAGTQRQHDTRYAALPEKVADDDADGLARRGAAFLAAGQLQRALADLDRACALKPEVAGYALARARVHQALRNRDAALADVEAALRLEPALAEARLMRASARAARGQRDPALADLNELDIALPQSAHFRATMAEIYASLDRMPEALHQWALWLPSHETDTALPRALNARCWLRTRLGQDLPLALEDCQRAVDKDEGSAQHRSTLGWTHLRMGDAQRAKAAFDASLAIEAGRPWPLLGRGLSLLKLGQPDEAARDLAAARQAQRNITAAARKAGFPLPDGVD